MSRPLIVAHTGTGGERGRIMSPDGISVALSATDYKDPPKVLVEEKVNGRQNNCSRLTEPGKGSSGQGPSSIGGGYLPSNKGNRLQRSSESACGIYDPYNKALYELICPTLLASDYKHLKYVIEEL
jgi:hypothetical protein